MNKTSWEIQKGYKTYYVYINGPEIIIGDHSGSGHTDNAIQIQKQDFLKNKNQRFQDIYNNMGEKVLLEILTTLKNKVWAKEQIEEIMKVK